MTTLPSGNSVLAFIVIMAIIVIVSGYICPSDHKDI